jgi:TatD-related deoxyribonuclease
MNGWSFADPLSAPLWRTGWGCRLVGRLLFADGHVHGNSVQGLGAGRVAAKFAEAGGWFMAFVSLPPWHYGVKPRSIEDYRRVIEHHIAECREASRFVRTACLAGFHPAEVDGLISEGWKPEDVLRLGIAVVDLVVEYCRRGLLDGIGEVGRQHFKTTPERLAIASTVMLHAIEASRDNNCLVHLHLENAGEATVATVDYIVKAVNAEPRLILFHHASVKVAAAATRLGYSATVPGKKEQLRAAFQKAGPVFIPESDFIDDPRRPCVSSCPWEIVERQKQLLSEGSISEEEVYRVNVDNVVRFYRVEPP